MTRELRPPLSGDDIHHPCLACPSSQCRGFAGRGVRAGRECVGAGWEGEGVDPADFYTGLVAELYAPLRSGTPDADRYVRFVREHGEPALELGCGDGDP